MNRNEMFEQKIKDTSEQMREKEMPEPYRVRVTPQQAAEFGVSNGTKIHGVTVEVVDE